MHLCLSGCTLRRLLRGVCLLVKYFVSCTCCACPAAPLGDFCMDLSFEKDFVLCTCAYPAAPLGDFCMDFVAREGSLRYLSR